MNPKYPIYIISKGRWESRLTSKSLERMKVPYRMIVEEQEYDNYASVIDPQKLLILPIKYKEDFDTYWKNENGQTGSGPARNFAWEHSIEEGHDNHWLLDDNIYDFYRFNNNTKNIVMTGTIFRCAEDFVDRYENIAISGFNYCKFCIASEKYPPFQLNTRIYSCLLIKNNIPFRWRGIFNEDTDLSIRVLKEGYSTLLFNAFLCEKATTQRLKGGNTDTIYTDGTKKKSEMIQEMHPDVCEVTWKFNRWHHHCDYSIFKRNKLIKKKDLNIPKGVNNYGMVFKEINPKDYA